MATVLEEYTTEKRRSLVRFLWEKWLKSQMMPDHVALLRLRQKQLCSGWKS
jgi:hypothetical protein